MTHYCWLLCFSIKNEDIYKEIFNAIWIYTNDLIEESHKNYDNFLNNINNNVDKLGLIQTVWWDLGIEDNGIIKFILEIQNELETSESFNRYPWDKNSYMFSILERYSINQLNEAKQFDAGWKKYVNSGIYDLL